RKSWSDQLYESSRRSRHRGSCGDEILASRWPAGPLDQQALWRCTGPTDSRRLTQLQAIDGDWRSADDCRSAARHVQVTASTLICTSCRVTDGRPAASCPTKDLMMKALVWCSPYNVSVENVPDPKILNRRDAIVRITSTCICGSDLHLVDGFIPFMKPGDILGHEPMGIVEEVGPDVDTSKVKVGDRVVVPFPIACGECFFCRRQLYSCCDNTNPKAHLPEKTF